MKPPDIARLVTVGAPVLAPDASTVAYLVTRVDLEGNAYRSAIWLAASDGSAPPRQLTSGEHGDGQPAWSPDGTRIAFTRHRAGGDPTNRPRHTLHVLPVDGIGETVTIAERNEAIKNPVWSPDGSAIAFNSRVRGPRYEPESERAQEPRRIDRLFSRLNGEGWTIDRPTHVFLLPADGGAPPRQLTDGPEAFGPVTWSPDGRRLVFQSARHPHADLDRKDDLWSIAVDPAAEDRPEPLRLTRTEGAHTMPSFHPDGQRLAFYLKPVDVGYHHGQLWVLDLARETCTRMAGDLDRNLSAGDGSAPAWDGDDLLTSVEDRGTVQLLRIAADGSMTRPVAGPRWVTGWSFREGALAFTAMDGSHPTELFCLHQGAERQVTHHQRAFCASCAPLEPERFTVQRDDGPELDGWILRPPEFDRDRRYPALLTIHGGPASQYGDRWFDEVQLHASAGFVVVWTNPRGSSGVTEAFGRAIISPRSAVEPGSGWGGVDYQDLMTFLDVALDREPAIDRSRLGVLGGSYGGYMTSWIVGHTDRFAAACSERAVNNLLSEDWSSDIATFLQRSLGIDPLEHPDEYLRMSPITHVKEITTPLLILHSEQDLRCPIEQADCLWTALHRLGQEVEYYRFPAESHELSRAGSPKHRIQRAELILDWFRRKLGEESEPEVRREAAAGVVPGR
ncbi:MAG: S9 family peptidase [Candidatus Dormibacteraceae bacterium]